MLDKDFDKIFREKLEAHNEPVDDSIWAAIESSLDKEPAVVKKPVAVPFVKRLADRSGSVGIRRIGYYIASTAAVVLLALLLFRPDNQPYIHSDEQIAIFDPNEQPIEKTDALALNHAKEAPQSNEYMEDAGFYDAVVNKPAAVDAAPASDNAVIPETQENEQKVDADKAGDAEKLLENKPEKQTESKSGSKDEDTVKDLMAWNNAEWDVVKDYESKSSKKQYSVSLFSNVISNNNISVSPQYLSSMAASGISHSSSDMQTMEIISEANYSLPVNIGAQAQVKVNSYLSVGFGINYTRLSSKYDGLVNKKYYRIKQNLHYIGIPVNAYFTLLNNDNLYFYANIGGTIEKGVKASYKLKSYDGAKRETSAKIDGFQYSSNAGIGLEYRFIEQFGLYLEPNIVYYFDSNIPASIRTDQPLQVKAEFGVRFHIQ